MVIIMITIELLKNTIANWHLSEVDVLTYENNRYTLPRLDTNDLPKDKNSYK